MGKKTDLLLLIIFVAGCFKQIIQIRFNIEIMVTQVFLIYFYFYFLLASQKKTAGKTA